MSELTFCYFCSLTTFDIFKGYFKILDFDQTNVLQALDNLHSPSKRLNHCLLGLKYLCMKVKNGQPLYGLFEFHGFLTERPTLSLVFEQPKKLMTSLCLLKFQQNLTSVVAYLLFKFCDVNHFKSITSKILNKHLHVQ